MPMLNRSRYITEGYNNPSPAWQVQFTRSEEIGIVIITMQHRLGTTHLRLLIGLAMILWSIPSVTD